MSFRPRQLAATVATMVALGAGAAPALAGSRTSPSAFVKPNTPLTARIAAESPLIALTYRLKGGVDPSLEPDALASGRAASSVSRIHAECPAGAARRHNHARQGRACHLAARHRHAPQRIGLLQPARRHELRHQARQRRIEKRLPGSQNAGQHHEHP